MPFVSENTKNGIDFRLHDTAEEAVRYLLDEIGPDYADKFWASDDGLRIERAPGMTDFNITVHNSIRSAAAAQMDLDLVAIPFALRALAEAVETYVEA